MGLIGAVEAGGTKFVLALFGDEHLIERATLPTTSPEETFAQTRAFFEESDRHGPLDAIGVASFGPIDIDPASATYGVIQATPKPGWRGADYRDALSSFGVPIWIDTDVNGAALGEARAGAGQGHRTIAYATIGTGIGVGVVKDGRPLAGFTHYEMGHVRPPRAVDDHFPGRCPTHRDCLEGLAAGPAILDRWGASLSDLPPTHEALAMEAEYLAHLATTIAFCHAPDRIVMGGGVMKAPGLIDAVRARTATLIGGYLSSGTLTGDLSAYIVPPGLGDDAGITGAALLGRLALTRAHQP